MSLLPRLIALSVAVWVAAVIVPGIEYENVGTILIASLVLAMLNTFLRPVLLLLSLPFLVLSLGLFYFVINTLLLMLTGWIVPGFQVEGFLSALAGSLIISLVNLFLGANRREKVRVETGSSRQEEPSRRGPPPGKGDVIDV